LALLLAAAAASADVNPWAFHAHPDVWAVMLGLAGLYVWAVRVVGPRKVVPGEPVLTRKKAVLFGLGLLALWVHADWPIHDLGENYLFSVHMVQHTGITLIAPPLLLLGMPAWMLRWLFVDNPKVHWVAKRLFRPLPAAIVYNLMTVLTHWPLVVNNSLEHHPVHLVVHVVMFASAAAMWFPVVNSVPELPTMSHPLKMMYLFLQSVIPTIPASFLTFGETPLYSYYAHVPRPFHYSVVEDQQLAGALMKVYAGTLLWGVIVGVFFRWYAAEEEGRGRRRRPDDVLTWDDVQRELERTGPPPAE
jgi:putative membrane protein